MFISVYASGTNVQRLAKCARKIDGVLYTSYAQLEKEDPNIIRRKFYCTEVASLKAQVEALDETVQPSWTKIWGKPQGNLAFIGQLFESLTGKDTLRTELNLAALADEPVDCFMLLVSANKKDGMVNSFTITATKAGTARIKLPFPTFYIAGSDKMERLESPDNKELLLRFEEGGKAVINNGFE